MHARGEGSVEIGRPGRRRRSGAIAAETRKAARAGPETVAPGPYSPPGLILQWHITERCNLRCAHCYQDAYSGDELDYQDLLKILEQYVRLLTAWRRRTDRAPFGQVTITGGEPFARRDFLPLLEVVAAYEFAFGFAILTNGSFIDAAMARRLARLGPNFVQVSIEGAEATHDRIRGPGQFDRTVDAVKRLVGEGIRTVVSFTAHRGNYREFAAVARLGARLGVSRVWADRLVPWGSGALLREQVLTPDETREFFEIMKRARDANPAGPEISMRRALQFLVGGDEPYRCGAGDRLVTVQPNGDLYPCRRMPVRVGNLMESSLSELYDEAPLFRSLRDPGRVAEGCRTCAHAEACRGGLKCLSYAVGGDPFRPDPGCWRASDPPARS